MCAGGVSPAERISEKGTEIMDEKIDAKQYEEKYKAILAYEEEQHRANQHRIRVGIRLNPIIPLVFLILSFLNSDSKLIFLILWIVSLFGIAFYLMYVEYSDYILQEKMREFGFRHEDEKTDTLVGHSLSAASDAALDRADEIDEKITETRADIRERIDTRRDAAKDAIEAGAQATKEILEDGKDKAKVALKKGKRRTKKALLNGKTLAQELIEKIRKTDEDPDTDMKDKKSDAESGKRDDGNA